MNEEDMRRLEEEFRKLRISDVLAQTVYTVSQLGWQRLSGDGRDLEQARLAIDALRALVPVLKGAIPDTAHRDFQQVVTNMQLAYAGAVAETPKQEPVPEPEPEAAAEPKAAAE